MWLAVMVPVTKQGKFIEEVRPHCTRVYVPMLRYLKKVKHKSKPVEMSRPAFGAYMFLKVRTGRIRKIADCTGFGRFVHQGEDLVPVTAGTIKRIKALEKLNWEPPPPVARDIRVGDNVKVMTDAFEGNVGKVINMLRKGQCEITLGNMAFVIPIDRITLA